MITAVAVVCCVFVLFSGVIVFRALITVEKSSQRSFKSDTQERRDFFQMLEKLVEKACTNDMPTTLANHTAERSQRILTDAKVDQTELWVTHEMPIEDDSAVNV